MKKDYFLQRLLDIAIYVVSMLIVGLVVNLLGVPIHWQLPVYFGIVLACGNNLNRRLNNIESMKNYRKRYKNLSDGDWYNNHYDNKSLGETEEIVD